LSPPIVFKALLDASVPDKVARVLSERGHQVIRHCEVLEDGTADVVVARTAMRNGAILVANDADMKRLTSRFGGSPGTSRFDRLNLIKLGCNEPLTAKRLDHVLSLIEHEWHIACEKPARRLWIEVAAHFVRTFR
jgi:predicted nuclease of predicted toxin-antitoxin system